MRDYKPPTNGHDKLLADNDRLLVVRCDAYTLNQINGPVGGGVLRAGIQLIGYGDGSVAMVLSEPHRPETTQPQETGRGSGRK